MKPEHKPYPMNMNRPHYKLRSERIKEHYLKSGVFKDNGQFDCGDHMSYEMERDLDAMKMAIRMIRDYMSDFLDDDDVQVEPMTMKEMLLVGAINTLRERINVTGDDLNRYETTEK